MRTTFKNLVDPFVWYYGSYLRTMAQPSSSMERNLYESFRPRLPASKQCKLLGPLIISLVRLKLSAPASGKILETSSMSSCLRTMTIHPLPDVLEVVIPTNCFLGCGTLKSCLRNFMDTMSAYLCFPNVASLDAFILIVVSSQVLELLKRMDNSLFCCISEG